MANFFLVLFLSFIAYSAGEPISCMSLPKEVFEDNESVKVNGPWVMIKSNYPEYDNCTKYDFNIDDSTNNLKVTWNESQLTGDEDTSYLIDATFDQTMTSMTTIENGFSVTYYALISNTTGHYNCIYSCNGDRIDYMAIGTTVEKKEERKAAALRDFENLKSKLGFTTDIPIVVVDEGCKYKF